MIVRLLWISEVSSSSPALTVASSMTWSEACGSPLSRGRLRVQHGGPVGSVQASFRVLMGKEGMVTIVTGLSTV